LSGGQQVSDGERAISSQGSQELELPKVLVFAITMAKETFESPMIYK